MGTLVTFESHGLLLQREDFPGALRALQKIAKTVPGFFRDEKAVRASKDLMTALRAGEFPAEVDAYGDVIGIRYIGDKWPPGGPDDFPEHLVFGLAKFLRKTSFHLWVEGVPGVRKFWVERGKVHSQVHHPSPRSFEQLGPPPRCRPGDTVEVRFRLVSTDPDDTTEVAVVASDSAEPVRVSFEPRKMRPGDEAVVTVTVKDDYVFLPEGRVGPRLIGDPRVHGTLEIFSELPDYDHDAALAVVASQCTPAPTGRTRIYLSKTKLAAALVDMKRYAARHVDEPGGAFLAGVSAATDLAAALRAASLEPTFDAAGHLRGLAFAGAGLPGGERHLHGLLLSYAALTDCTGELALAYAETPDRWTRFLFSAGSVRRWRQRRLE